MKPTVIFAVLALGLSACGATPPPASTPPVVYRDPLADAALPAPPARLGEPPISLKAQRDALFAQVCRLSAFVIEAVPLLDLGAGRPARPTLAYPECDLDDR